MSNRFVPIPVGTDMAQTVAAVNNNFAELDSETFTKIYNDSNGIPNIIIGILPDGTTGIVVSKEGIDVTTLFA